MLVISWIVIAVLAAAIVVGVWTACVERRRPASSPRGGDLAWWGLLSADEQEDVDTAALDAAEQAEIDAAADARDSAEFLVQRAQFNALYRP